MQGAGQMDGVAIATADVYPHHGHHQRHHLRRPANAEPAFSDQHLSGCHSDE